MVGSSRFHSIENHQVGVIFSFLRYCLVMTNVMRPSRFRNFEISLLGFAFSRISRYWQSSCGILIDYLAVSQRKHSLVLDCLVFSFQSPAASCRSLSHGRLYCSGGEAPSCALAVPKMSLNVVPVVPLFTLTSPACACMIERTIARPRPPESSG